MQRHKVLCTRHVYSCSHIHNLAQQCNELWVDVTQFIDFWDFGLRGMHVDDTACMTNSQVKVQWTVVV